MKTLQELKETGFADYHELNPFITKRIDLELNDFGFRDRYVVLTDGSQWDYIPEDRLYELRIESHEIPTVTNY